MIVQNQFISFKYNLTQTLKSLSFKYLLDKYLFSILFNFSIGPKKWCFPYFLVQSSSFIYRSSGIFFQFFAKYFFTNKFFKLRLNFRKSFFLLRILYCLLHQNLQQLLDFFFLILYLNLPDRLITLRVEVHRGFSKTSHGVPK